MKNMTGVWFILVCCAFAVGLIVFDSTRRGQKEIAAISTRSSGCEYEVWTDEKTGYRFLVATRKWNIGGVGVFLIPDREEENDCAAPALAEKVILESTVGWKEIQ